MKIMKFFEDYKNKTLTFYAINLYILLLVLIPKSLTTLFNIIPVRILLSLLLFLIIGFDFYKKKINLNKNNNKLLLVCFALFILTCIPSFFVSLNKVTTLYTICKFVSYGLVFFAISSLEFKKEDYGCFIKTFCFALGITLILGIIFYIFDINLFVLGIEMFPYAKGRVNTTFFNTNFLGIYINIFFLFLLYFFNKIMKEYNKLYKIIISLLLILTPLVLIFTFSRTSFLIFCAQLIMLIVLVPKLIFNKKTLIALVLSFTLICMVPATFGFVKGTVKDGINVVTGGWLVKENNTDSVTEDVSLTHRQAFNTIALRIFKNNKFQGVGFGAYIDYLESPEFDKIYSDYNYPKIHPHSGEVLMLAEVGMIPSILFNVFCIIILLRFVIYYFSNYKKNLNIKYLSAVGGIVYFGFMIINVMTESYSYDTQVYSLLILVMALIFSYFNGMKDNVKRFKFLI